MLNHGGRLRNQLAPLNGRSALRGAHGYDVTVKRAAAIIQAWNSHRQGLPAVTFDWPHSASLPDVVS